MTHLTVSQVSNLFIYRRDRRFLLLRKNFLSRGKGKTTKAKGCHSALAAAAVAAPDGVGKLTVPPALLGGGKLNVAALPRQHLNKELLHSIPPLQMGT
jgi:hypothetical protein